MTGQNLHLIVALDTDRILWFGWEPPIDVDPEAVHATYSGDVPPSMTPTNCNQYRLVNKQIIPPATGQRKVSILEENRDTIRSQIEALVAQKRQPYLADSPASSLVRELKLKEAMAVKSGSQIDPVFLPQVATQLGLRNIGQAATAIMERHWKMLDVLAATETIRVQAILGVAAAKSLNDLHAVKHRCIEQLEA